ncbi:MAG: hypothetical protein GY822_22715 [Deltaproteobacteria bacterium]|nr:hypothetical protein [Deltaproteobacteria bacterium]
MIGVRPEINSISPTQVDMGNEPSATVSVAFRFLGEKAMVGVRPLQLLDESAFCIPFLPLRTEVIPASASTEERGTLTFELPALGAGEYEAYIQANELEASISFSVTSTAPEGHDGLHYLKGPDGALLDANRILKTQLSIDATAPNLGLWSYTEPVRGGLSPLRFVGDGVGSFQATFPVARGPQTLWTLADGLDSVCGRIVDTVPAEHPDLLEVGLSFRSLDGDIADLDLYIVANLENQQPQSCSVNQPAGLCLHPSSLGLISDDGFEFVHLALEDGIYGIAVRTGAVTSSIEATLRISVGNEHLDFLGPRRLQTSEVQTWLAARIYVIGGSITLETVDVLASRFPDDVTTW